jgi:hypothetical protein
LGGLRIFAKGRAMRAPDRGGKAIDVSGFERGTEGIQLDRVRKPHIAHHLAELGLREAPPKSPSIITSCPERSPGGTITPKVQHGRSLVGTTISISAIPLLPPLGTHNLAGETQRILFSGGTLLLLSLLPSSISPGIIASTTGQFSAIALPGP